MFLQAEYRFQEVFSVQGFHVSPGEFDESAVLHVDVMPLQVSVLIGEAFPAEVRQEMKNNCCGHL